MEPYTFPRMPVIALTFLFWELSTNSSCMEEPDPVINEVLADSRSGSPEKADTRILPAGTLNEKNPSSFAWVLPMGIQ